MSLYLILNIASVSFPFLFSFHPKIKFYKEWRHFLPALLITGVIFVLWDIQFTKMGIWGFNARYLEGIYVSGLPIEEILFFICIPFSSIFTIHCIKVFWPDFQLNQIIRRNLVFILSAFLIITGLIHHDKWYTCSTGLFSGLTLIFAWVFSRKILDHFFLTYPLILIPFFIVNGILTGSFIEGEVVWYNNQENLGIRMFTIPVEDTFYGLSLLLLSCSISEILKNRKST